MNRLPQVVIVVALVALGYFGYRWYAGTGDEGRIRAALEELAAAVSEPGAEGLAQMTRAAALGGFFAPDVEVDLGPPFAPFRGRDTIMAMAAKAAVPGQGLDVRFVDVEVDVAPGGADAVARMTATVAERGVAADRGIDARELEMAWRKVDGDWVIARVTGIETLQRPR